MMRVYFHNKGLSVRRFKDNPKYFPKRTKKKLNFIVSKMTCMTKLLFFVDFSCRDESL